MILITGGAWQGKLSFALELAGKNGERNPQVANGETDPLEAAFQSPVLYGLHHYVRRLQQEEKSVAGFLEQLERQNPNAIVITNELGCGIVPQSAWERRYREGAGRAAVRLAKTSGAVYRVVCGIATQIK